MVTKTSTTMLTERGKSRYSEFKPEFRIKAFDFSH